MARQSRESFYRDMNRILDRVYKADAGPRSGPDRTRMAEHLVRAREGAQALEDALAGLRDLRERSQGLTAVREELDYLREQVLLLRFMSAEISLLRLQLGEPTRAPRELADAGFSDESAIAEPLSGPSPSRATAPALALPAPAAVALASG